MEGDTTSWGRHTIISHVQLWEKPKICNTKKTRSRKIQIFHFDSTLNPIISGYNIYLGLSAYEATKSEKGTGISEIIRRTLIDAN